MAHAKVVFGAHLHCPTLYVLGVCFRGDEASYASEIAGPYLPFMQYAPLPIIIAPRKLGIYGLYAPYRAFLRRRIFREIQ